MPTGDFHANASVRRGMMSKMVMIAIGTVIAGAIGMAVFGHTFGEMVDRSYFMLCGAAIALFIK